MKYEFSCAERTLHGLGAVERRAETRGLACYTQIWNTRRVRLWEKLRREFLHAFAVTPSVAVLSPEENVLLEKIARLIVNRGMAVPAALFLESLGPLSFLGSQVVHGLKPFLDVVIDPADAERLAVLLERRDSIERLSTLLQEQANTST